MLYDSNSPINASEQNLLTDSVGHMDEHMFDFLFTSYYSGLVIYACKQGLRQETAEDLVQEVFVNLWNKRVTINIHHSFKSFLFVSVTNRIKDYYKHEDVKNKAIEKLRDFCPEYSYRDFVVEKELRSSINHAIDKLPEKCKRIFIEYKIQKKTVNEIADIENISRRTVEIHLGKAYRLLRTYLRHILCLILFYIVEIF